MKNRRGDYEAIAMRWLPRGYRVEYRKGLSGRHYGSLSLIEAPRPTTPETLYIFLHECAHAYLHTGSGWRVKPYMAELEAELWAHAKMAEAGVPVPPEMTERAKQYVALKIVQAERRGGKNFDRRALEYAGKYLAAVRAYYDRRRLSARDRARLAMLRARDEAVRAAIREIGAAWVEEALARADFDFI